jgi:hypothetical protein
MISRLSVLTIAALLIEAPASTAQTPKSESGAVRIERNFDIQVIGSPNAPIEFMAPPIAFDNDTIAGAPYSAEAVTEVVQSLADGNRIFRESKARVARDSAGRTRREESLTVFGPMVNSPEDFRQVQITDPESKTIVMLDMKNKRAHKMPALNIRLTTNRDGQSAMVAGRKLVLAGEPPAIGEGAGVRLFYNAATGGPVPAPVTESLGKQFMEGVEVEGTRTTFTMPAGQIGNELPIKIVSERWYCPELKVLVMSRQSDPRFGDTTYRLTNILRTEPAASLFEVPPDFTIDESGTTRDVIFRKLEREK